MARRLGFLTSFVLLVRPCQTDTFFKLFQVEHGFSDNGQATFWTITLPSVTACVSMCLKQNACLAVVHHSATQMCSFLDSNETLTDTQNSGYSYVFVGGPCAEGWLHLEGSCYLFGQQTYNWLDSMSFCQSLGASLVEIETPSENYFIQERLSNIANPKHWIGMTDIDQEDVWVWASGVIASYIDWGTDQPNNGIVSNCGGIWESFDNRWVDEPCTNLFYPICEQLSTRGP